jgi:DnaJ-class molecular chaperone
MKIECPVCHVQGLLQQRGNSYRVQHYQGFENGKRLYQYHKIDNMEVNGSNGSKLLEVKETASSTFEEKIGAADRIRTYDRLVNSQPLYRAEPRRHSKPIHFQFNKTI